MHILLKLVGIITLIVRWIAYRRYLIVIHMFKACLSKWAITDIIKL